MATDSEPLNLLFVCTGNLCRSPMAAAIADQIALQLDLPIDARSAGTASPIGRAPPRQVIAVCREIGLDLADHRSRPLLAHDVRQAHRILVMEDAHALAVRELVPDVGDRVIPLGPFAGLDRIADPMGSWLRGPYRRTRDDLRRALTRLLQTLRA